MTCNLELSKLLFEVCQPPAPPYKTAFINTLCNWQALIAGSFALLGGLLLWKQIQIQKSEIKRQREREVIVARMKLPHAIAELHRYLEAVFNDWWSGRINSQEKQRFPEGFLGVVSCAASVTGENDLIPSKNW